MCGGHQPWVAATPRDAPDGNRPLHPAPFMPYTGGPHDGHVQDAMYALRYPPPSFAPTA